MSNNSLNNNDSSQTNSMCILTTDEDYQLACIEAFNSLSTPITTSILSTTTLIAYGELKNIVEICLQEIPYVRHIGLVVAVVEGKDTSDISDAIIAEKVETDATSLQISNYSEEASTKLEDVRADLMSALNNVWEKPARANKENVLGVFIGPKKTYVTHNTTESSLSDWPGGNIRLKKTPKQISRSEFKLEELFSIIDTVPVFGKGQKSAVDLGASPGGWSRILFNHGFKIKAIDPARIDDELFKNKEVHYLELSAQEFIRESNETFSLIVNDMRMDPYKSIDLINEAIYLLRPKGHIIMTIKLNSDFEHSELGHYYEEISQDYERIFARQLFHNRNEITIVLKKLK